MSIPVTPNFEILASQHYGNAGGINIMCPYGQGVLESFSGCGPNAMVKIKLQYGGVISILAHKCRIHRQFEHVGRMFGMGLLEQSVTNSVSSSTFAPQEPSSMQTSPGSAGSDTMDEQAHTHGALSGMMSGGVSGRKRGRDFSSDCNMGEEFRRRMPQPMMMQ